MRRQNYEYPQPPPRARIGRFFTLLGILALVAVAASIYVTLQRLDVQALAMMTGGMLVFTGMLTMLILVIFAVVSLARIFGRNSNQAPPQQVLPVIINPQPAITTNAQQPNWNWNQPGPAEQREWEVQTMGGREK